MKLFDIICFILIPIIVISLVISIITMVKIYKNRDCDNTFYKEYELALNASEILLETIRADGDFMEQNLLTRPLPNKARTLELTELSSQKYNSKKALFTMDLIQLAYYIGDVYPYDGQSNTETTIKNFLTSYLPQGATCTGLIIGTLNKMDIFHWYHNYSGLIIEYTIGTYTCSFIVFKGTQKVTEWYENAKIALSSATYLPSDCSVYLGFDNMYSTYVDNDSPVKTMRDQVLTYLKTWTKDFVISGHSMGSYLSALITVDLTINFNSYRSRSQTYLFAGHHIGNQAVTDRMGNSFKGIYNIMNNYDIITTTRYPYYGILPAQSFCYLDTNNGNRILSHTIPNMFENVLKNSSIFDDNALKDAQTCGMVCV